MGKGSEITIYQTFIIQKQILLNHPAPVFELQFNSLPNNKILDETKLKAHADDELNVAKMTISL